VIQDENAPKVSGHTAAIYEDCLFVFGGRNTGAANVGNNSLWCYDLSIYLSQKDFLISQIDKRAWKLCETVGEGPKPKEGAKSWIKDGNLYIYGGSTRNSKNKVNYSELFKLNLSKIYQRFNPAYFLRIYEVEKNRAVWHFYTWPRLNVFRQIQH